MVSATHGGKTRRVSPRRTLGFALPTLGGLSNRNRPAFKNVANSINLNEKVFSNRNSNSSSAHSLATAREPRITSHNSRYTKASIGALRASNMSRAIIEAPKGKIA
jgi:hypothetical protein